MNDKIYNYLLNNNVYIDKDLFDYGLYSLSTYIKYFLFIIPLAFSIGILFETMLFVILFIPLRRYVGGYHLENINLCFFCSVLLALIIPIAAKYTYFNSYYPIVSAFLLCFIFTQRIGVIDHPNKEISFIEKKHFLLNSLIIEFTYFIISLVSFLLKSTIIHNTILYIFIFFLLSMLLCEIKKTMFTS